MLVSDWMTKKVITTTPNDTLLTCIRLFKAHSIKRMPVVNRAGRLQGFITSRDLHTFSPDIPTGLGILEAINVLGETRVGDVMDRHPHTISSDEPLEKAAFVMYDAHVDALVVTDSDNHVVGIITAARVFRGVLSSTGATQKGEQLGFLISNQPNTLKPIIDILREYPVSIITILSSLPEEDVRSVRIRYRTKTPGDTETIDAVIERFRDYPGIRCWTKDGKLELKDEEHPEHW